MSTALPTPLPADRRGFSLLEVLVAMVILTVIASSAVGFFRSQNQSMIKGAERLDIVQNGRFGVSQVERVVRTMGSGVTGLQPMLVYGGDSVVAINTDYVENDSTDFRWATNLNPYLPDAATLAWDFADRTVVPTTTYMYPPLTFRQANGATSPAETIIFYVEPDASTSRTDDLVLMMRINNQAPDLVTRNLLPYPGRPFFEYSLARRLGSGADTMFFASGTLKPLIRRIPDATFSGTDSANAIRPDSVRAIRINFKVTNGLIGTDERTSTLSTMIAIPNNGLLDASICGRSPFPAGALVATPDPTPGSGWIDLAWTPSPDQDGGEADVWQYVVYRRVQGITVWDDPILNMRRDTLPVYNAGFGGHISGSTYEFAVAAQDCTPRQSTLIVATAIAP